MAVNITNITNIENWYDWGTYASNASNGLFWGLILIALFFVVITRLRHQETENAVAAASFSCLLLSVLLLNLGWLQLAYPIFFAFALGGSLFYIRFKPQ